MHMKQRLYTHCLKEDASAHEHLTVFKEILSNLEAIEVQYGKEDLGLILLCSLPPSYSTFRDTILYSRESLTVDEVYDSLTSYDKMKYLAIKPDSQGEDRDADDNRGRTQEWNPRSKSKGRSKSSNRGKTCNFYKKKGHIKSECYKLQNKIKREVANQKGKQLENFGEADAVEDYSDSELLVTSVKNSKVSEEWILDSGCTFHMSPNRDWFTTYKTVSEGVGTDTAKSGVLKISKGPLVVMKGQRKTTKLYVLQGSTVISDTTVVSSSLANDNITKLWHMRLGHMNEDGMLELSKRGLLDEQGIWKLKFCEHYVFGKQKRVRFTRGIHNTKGMLEYIHSNLWGPSRKRNKPPKKYAEADLVAYALNVAEDIDVNQEPSILRWFAVKTQKSKEGSLGVEKLKYKARLVAKGYSQIPIVDFTGVFSPIVKHSSIRALLGIVAMHDLELEQLDVKTTFLYGELEKDIYMQQPEGFTVSERGLCLLAEKVPLRFETVTEIVVQESAKPVSTPLAAYFILSSALSHVPYSSAMFGRTRNEVIGYVDANFSRDLDRRRSLTSYFFTIGGCAISWKATLQTTVALTTTEAEYMAITEACKEAIWLKGFFSELNEDLQISTVFCESQSAIFLTKDQMFHERTKHIDVRYHFVRDEELVH
ncbi:hypothetical protein CXB51_025814 [Gossypium anomalum]|uniref:Reverse transcriptase Ty1/copia-type domain-containing protein n=1 Tax=Gossypium anomalum TaxID=47600 RepID=A0A8J5Y3M5_9ROSI|nr:hypothetical protein CXB51_025814 [Gossypium anomalum]